MNVKLQSMYKICLLNKTKMLLRKTENLGIGRLTCQNHKALHRECGVGAVFNMWEGAGLFGQWGRGIHSLVTGCGGT